MVSQERCQDGRLGGLNLGAAGLFTAIVAVAAVGFMNAVAMLAAVLSPPTSGWLKDVTHSLGAAFYLGGALILCGAIACLFVEETIKRPAGRR